VAGWSEGRFYISIISDLSECVTDLGSAEIGVQRLMQILYYNFGGYIEDQLQVARRKCGYSVNHVGGINQEYTIGGSPFLMARYVYDFEVHDGDESEVATWIERRAFADDRCNITEIRRWKHTYKRSTNRITDEELLIKGVGSRS
jgi:hypothetical protein